MFRPSLAIAIAAALLVPGHAMAEKAPAATQQAIDPAYTALVEAINVSEAQRAVMLDRIIDSAVDQLGVALPVIGNAMKTNPAIAADLKTAITPIFADYSQSKEAGMRADMAAIFAEYLSTEEARSLSAFYTSPLGQRLQGALVQNYDASSVVVDAMDGSPVEQSSVTNSIGGTARAGLASLSQADQKAIGVFMATPAAQHLTQAMPKMIEVRTRYENSPLTAEQQAAMNAAMLPVLQKYFPRPSTN